jgi:hypothetical protein
MKRIVLLFLTITLFVQVHSQYQYSYGTPGDESGQSIRWTYFDNGYIIGGYSDYKYMPGYNATLSKISEDGYVNWTTVYGGDGYDYFNSVRQINTEKYLGYVALGTTNSIGAGGTDMFMVRTDTIGGPVSVCTYGGGEYEGGSCLQVVKNPKTRTPELVMIGYSSSYYPVIDKKMFIVKTTITGKYLDAIVFGDEGAHAGYWVEQTSDGGFIAVGTTSNSCCCGHSPGIENYDIYVVKLDYYLNVEWARIFGGGSDLFVDDVAKSVKETYDGYIITGYTESFSENNSKDVFLLNLDKKGNFKWLKNFGTPGDDTGNDVLYIKNSSLGYDFIVNGTTTIDGIEYGLLLTTDYYGNMKWSKIYGMKKGDEKGLEIVRKGEKGYAFTGQVESFGQGLRDIYLVTTDDYGNSNCPACEDKIKMTSKKHDPCIKKSYRHKHVETGMYQEIKYDYIGLEREACPKYFIIPPFFPKSTEEIPSEIGELILYPNPASGSIQLELPKHFTSGNIKVFNSTGKLVSVKFFSETDIVKLSVENLTNGLYVVHIITNTGESLKTNFIKQN